MEREDAISDGYIGALTWVRADDAGTRQTPSGASVNLLVGRRMPTQLSSLRSMRRSQIPGTAVEPHTPSQTRWMSLLTSTLIFGAFAGDL